MLLLSLACSDGPHDSGTDGPLDTGDGCEAVDWYVDADGDGFGGEVVSACEQPSGTVTVAGDCDDQDAAVNPDAVEVCNRVDDDCDGVEDLDGWIPDTWDTFEAAVAEAPDGAHICVDEGSHIATRLQPEQSLHFLGAGPDTVLQAQETWMFHLAPGASLTLQDMTLEGVSVPAGRGGVMTLDGGAATLRRVRLPKLSASGSTSSGGLVFGHDIAVVVEDVQVDTLSVDTDASYGLLLYNQGGSLRVDGLRVLGGTVAGDTIGMLYATTQDTLQVSDLVVANLTLAPEDTVYALGGYFSGDVVQGSFHDVSIRDNVVQYTGAAHIQAIAPFGLYLDVYTDQPIDIDRLEVVRNGLRAQGKTVMRGGVVYSYDPPIHVDNAVIAGNTWVVPEGALQGGIAESGNHEVRWTNVDIAHNTWSGWTDVQGGVFINNGEGTVVATNTNVVGNVWSATTVYSTLWYSYAAVGDFEWRYSNLYGNTQAPSVWRQTAQDEPQTLSVDPMYMAVEDQDLRLQDGSPLIDAGDPEVLDADGSISDIGAWGGPGGWE